MLVIPDRFNKNATQVRAMGTPAETGARLIQYMCERIGIADLGDSDVLDFGCGCRFADSIINRRIPIRTYTGIDVDREMIDFLVDNVEDARLRLIWWNANNPHYNSRGTSLNELTELPIGGLKFDIICMFSVITHQTPEDSKIIFRLLRRCIRPDGHLFFSADIREMDSDYKELVPDAAAAHSAYSLALLQRLTERTGWRILSIEGKNPRGTIPIADSLLCVPVAPPAGV
jgi:SAM-dependent methyltransferase